MQGDDRAIDCELLGSASLPVRFFDKIKMHKAHLLNECALNRLRQWLLLLANYSTPDFCISLQDIFHELISLLKEHLFRLFGLALQEKNQLVVA